MASLIYIDESPERSIFQLVLGRTIIGRDPHVDIRIDDEAISSEHASISYENAEYVIRDHGSLNGTHVNGEKIEARILQHHDVIRLRQHMFLVSLVEVNEPVIKPLAKPMAQPQRPAVVYHSVVTAQPRVTQYNPMMVQRGMTIGPLKDFNPYQQMAPYLEKDKANNREILLFICLFFMAILVCYFGYKSISSDGDKSKETTKKELAAPARFRNN